MRSLEIRGVEEFDDESISSCLTTQERSRIRIGARGERACGTPPFDPSWELRLWAWPWTEHELYDPTAFRLDLERIKRWYIARGHGEVRITDIQILREGEEPTSDPYLPPCDPDQAESCRLRIRVEVEEGEATLVRELQVHGIDDLDPALARRLRDAIELVEGERFDEALFDRSVRAMRDALGDAGFALARIERQAEIDRAAHRADVRFEITPGPECVFGEVRVVGNGRLPVTPIREATLIEPGDEYREATLAEAQRAVYALGTFSGVVVEPILPDDGNVVDVRVRVTPGRLSRFSLGGGVQAGITASGGETIDVPQWDVHLITAWEHRNLFGGLRRFRIEDRPAMIFPDRFPRGQMPFFGNRLTIKFEQPAFLEPRTSLLFDGEWDYGPDPFDGFVRHDISSGIGVARSFFDQRLTLRAGLRGELYRVSTRQPRNAELHDVPSDSQVMFFEEEVRLDTRRNPLDIGSGGFHFETGAQQAGFILPSSWSYFRVTPDARGYIPLGDRVQIAMRFALGMLFINEADAGLDPESAALGPRTYRLRGGGATTNRGFLPGQLGDGEEGGVRRWLANVELRAQITAAMIMAAFADAGDVHREESFRWDHPQLSVGIGFRYLTIVGPIRLDLGFRIPGAQVFGEDDRPPQRENQINFFFARVPGAIHLTIGDSF